MIGRVMIAGALAALWAAAPAQAADNVMQVCGAKYQAAKKANQLNGQTWNQYLASCRTGLGKVAAAAPAAMPAAKPAAPMRAAPMAAAAKPAVAGAKAPSANQLAARDRQKKCGAMWKADKAAGKIAAGQTWPQYWSQCNTKLKG